MKAKKPQREDDAAGIGKLLARVREALCQRWPSVEFHIVSPELRASGGWDIDWDGPPSVEAVSGVLSPVFPLRSLVWLCKRRAGKPLHYATMIRRLHDYWLPGEEVPEWAKG